MPKAETTIQTDAPPERVWALLMDPERLGDWVTAHCDVSDVPEGGLTEGSSFRQTLKIAGSKFGVRWTINELEEPRLAVWSGAGPKGSTAKVRYELEPSQGGTRFRYCNEYELPGGAFGKLAGTVASTPAKRAMASSLKRLKRLVEAQG